MRCACGEEGVVLLGFHVQGFSARGKERRATNDGHDPVETSMHKLKHQRRATTDDDASDGHDAS